MVSKSWLWCCCVMAIGFSSMHGRSLEAERRRAIFEATRSLVASIGYILHDDHRESVRHAATGILEASSFLKIVSDLLDTEDPKIKVYTYDAVKKIMHLISMVDDHDFLGMLDDPRNQISYIGKDVTVSQTMMMAAEIFIRSAVFYSFIEQDDHLWKRTMRLCGAEVADWVELARVMLKLRDHRVARSMILSNLHEQAQEQLVIIESGEKKIGDEELAKVT